MIVTRDGCARGVVFTGVLGHQPGKFVASITDEFHFAEIERLVVSLDKYFLQRQRQIHHAVTAARTPPRGLWFTRGVVRMIAGQREAHVAPPLETNKRPRVCVVAAPRVLRAGGSPDLALGITQLESYAAPGRVAFDPQSESRCLARNRDGLGRHQRAVPRRQWSVAGLFGQRSFPT